MASSPRLSFWFWIYSTGGIGRSPWAPGSMASAACALLWRLAPPVGLPLSLILLSLLSVVGVVASEEAIRETGLKDPSVVVIDEWLGQGVALLAVPHSWWGAGLAFVFFRVFDILKPPPVSFLERAPGGIGVMLDDLGAGLLAALLLHYLFLLLPASGGGMA